MTPYQIGSILVPFDFSESSISAWNGAAKLAKLSQAELILLHVTSSASESTISSRERIESFVTDSGAELPKMRIIEEEGNPAEQILRVTAREKPSLIVMGLHGESGVQPRKAGSTAVAVVRECTCPVLFLPKDPGDDILFKRILFPVRPLASAFVPYGLFHPIADEKARVEVLGLSQLKLARMELVLERVSSQIRDRVRDKKIEVSTRWGHGNSITSDIETAVKLSEADLLVLSPALDGVPQPGKIGPFAEYLIHNSSTALLCLATAL